jgi:hypothetical protein
MSDDQAAEGPAAPPMRLLRETAQTNLDLYRQLHDRGWNRADLVLARDGYGLAMRLFSDRFRANGKPFVAHLVGTASLLATVGARPPIVLAGLLHAAYENGVFADGVGGASDEHRRIVRDAIGHDAEALVAAYRALKWTPATIEPLLAGWENVSAVQKDVLLMRVANELEDHLGLGMRLCEEGRGALGPSRDQSIAIARRLGQSDLTAALVEAFREGDEASWADALALPCKASFRVPASDTSSGSEHLAAAFRAARRKLWRMLAKARARTDAARS